MAVAVVTVPTVSFPSTATKPNKTICIDHNAERLSGHDDAGGLLQGYLCYRTGTTQKNDFTVAIDEHPGLTVVTFNILYAVEVVTSDIHQAYNHADAAYSANDPIVVVRLEAGKKYWLKVSGETIVEGTLYNPITGGFVGAIDDPTPGAIVGNTHGFIALAPADTLTGWAPFLYEGIVSIDTTAE